jgi:predicted nucleic acid-binding Zn ribbon protein
LPIRADHYAQWWTVSDAAASVLETGRAPRVLRVLRFQPKEPQAGLQPIDVAGDPAYRVDPYTDDVIRRLVELRAMLRADAATARAAGDARGSEELSARAGALKKSANSLAYGVPIEVNVTDFAKSIPVDVVRPDGSTFRAVGARRAEEPGEFFNPLLATLVVAGGRLLLATAMRLVRDAGGTYAYWDTDGLFVVATESGGQLEPRGLAADAGVAPVPALSRSTVRDVADRFASLNPYEPSLVPGSILNVVRVAFDPDTGVEREIWCLSLAAKRYCLFTLGADGRPSIARTTDDAYRSEHALGHLMAPDKTLGAGVWISRWWEHLVCLELKLDDPEPEWFDDPAYSPLTINSAADERAFRAFNSSRPYPLQVRPGGFGMVAHMNALSVAQGTPHVLVAQREDERAKRQQLVWFDRADASGKSYRIRTGDPSYIVPGVLTVQSYRDCFEEFRRHPEEKELGPDGEPCAPSTRGQLQPSTVTVVGVVRLGKEASRLVNTDSTEAVEFGAAEYRQSGCTGCGAPIPPGRRWCSEACRKRTERMAKAVPKVCGQCGWSIVGRRRWCSEVCRKRSERLAAR